MDRRVIETLQSELNPSSIAFIINLGPKVCTMVKGSVQRPMRNNKVDVIDRKNIAMRSLFHKLLIQFESLNSLCSNLKKNI